MHKNTASYVERTNGESSCHLYSFKSGTTDRPSHCWGSCLRNHSAGNKAARTPCSWGNIPVGKQNNRTGKTSTAGYMPQNLMKQSFYDAAQSLWWNSDKTRFVANTDDSRATDKPLQFGCDATLMIVN